MSGRQAVILASRVICVYLLFWVVSNFIDLPAYILALHQHSSVLTSTSYDRYWSHYYTLRLEALIVKSALELFFAGLFYRCGPRISQILGGGPSDFNSAKVGTAA